VGLFGKVNSPVGLDISSNTIRAAQLKPYSPKPMLLKIAETTVSGAVKDGEITDVDMAAEAISELWHSNKISERSVVLGISNQKVIVRLITMPKMKEDELKSAIDFQAQDHIPIPIEEAILDYKVVGEFKNEDNEEMIEVILVAAQKDMVAKQIQTLEKAKLKPTIVDLSSFSLVRSLLEIPAIVPEVKDIETAKKAVGLVDIGEDITNIVIVENYVPRFTRVASVADNTFIKALSDNMSVDYDEAQRLKNEYGLTPVAKANQKVSAKKTEKEKVEKVREILEEEGIRFISEIKRSFDYAVSESVNADKIDRIIISGKGSVTPNLVDQIQSSFQSKIELGNPLVSVSIDGQKEAEEKIFSYAISIGLALRGLEG
jgi:type IV pilus assembly protein PilM